MSWGAVVSGVVGVGTSLYGASQVTDAADEAAQQSSIASAEAIERGEEAFGQSEAALAPYAAQEQAASTQLMAQMGLAPPPQGSSDWGFGMGAGGGQNQNMDQFIEDLLTEQMVIAKRSGYNKQKGLNEGARRTVHFIDQLKSEGKLPGNFQAPSMTDLVQQAGNIENTYGGLTKMEKTLSPGVTLEGYGTQNIQGLLDKYQMGAPTDQMGPQEMGPQEMAEGAPAGPLPQTAGDIMGRAGVEGMSPELQERYQADIMEDPRNDPELAAYLGLTPESMDVGSSYQDTPAYQKAVEAGSSAVNQGAATAGSLYSGRRGLALRDVGQQVEQGYYMDAADRREAMMGARRGERAAGIGRRGLEVSQGRGREDSYYNNYMQMLTSMSAPQTTTNIESMRQGTARGESANIMGTARDVGNLGIASANANQAAMADIAGGVMEMGSSWIDRQDRPGGG